MSTQTRTLLFLAVFAVGGVTVLSMMAQRYAKILQEDNSVDAAVRDDVESFLEIRRSIHAVVTRSAERPDLGRQVRAARDRAVSFSKIDPGRYARIRTEYRAWRDGISDETSPYPRVFQEFVDRLREIDLGDYEPLDS